MGRRAPLDLDLVVCADGPMRGQWYTRSDWLARVEGAEYMAGYGQPRQVCLDYVATRYRVAHPTGDGRDGQQFTHRPT